MAVAEDTFVAATLVIFSDALPGVGLTWDSEGTEMPAGWMNLISWGEAPLGRNGHSNLDDTRMHSERN